MIDETEARRRILESVQPAPDSERIGLAQSRDRFVAEEIFGRVDLPGFDNSSMDGYAVRAATATKGARLRLAGEQPAGEDRQLDLPDGGAIRIFTGAPMPAGADAVVMQEDVQADGDTIEIVEGVESGENIRPRGGDICAGQRILSRGDRITSGRIGLLASQGIAQVEVAPRPSVGIVTTGDELIEVHPATEPEELKPGQIFNSNGPMLAALVRQFGGLSKAYHARDESAELRQTLEAALAANTFVLVAGGVSVGERDLVKTELASLGVASGFWRVRVKPGKPFLFGQRSGESPVHVFGLPGNPVSAFVTFLLFAAPALARYVGRTDLTPDTLPLPIIRRPLAERLTNRGDRPHYARVRIDADRNLRPSGLQQSHAVFGLSLADVLVRLEPGEVMEAGAEADAYLL